MRIRSLGKAHPVRTAIEALAAGEAIHIPTQDFKWKHKTPSYFTNQLHKTTPKRYTVSAQLDLGGWIVQRMV